jgi:hypothetical protein
MQHSHTPASAAQTTSDPGPLGLVPAVALGLPERLAGRVDEHTRLFVEHMRQGLLAPRPRWAWRSWPRSWRWR